METIMWYRLSIAASSMLVAGTLAATAAELPTYEVTGFPMTPLQASALGATGAREQVPTTAPELAGLPATPLQMAVLSRHAHDRKKMGDGGSRTTVGLATPSAQTR
jgi:hypothetical protein